MWCNHSWVSGVFFCVSCLPSHASFSSHPCFDCCFFLLSWTCACGKLLSSLKKTKKNQMRMSLNLSMNIFSSSFCALILTSFFYCPFQEEKSIFFCVNLFRFCLPFAGCLFFLSFLHFSCGNINEQNVPLFHRCSTQLFSLCHLTPLRLSYGTYDYMQDCIW